MTFDGYRNSNSNWAANGMVSRGPVAASKFLVREWAPLVLTEGLATILQKYPTSRKKREQVESAGVGRKRVGTGFAPKLRQRRLPWSSLAEGDSASTTVVKPSRMC